MRWISLLIIVLTVFLLANCSGNREDKSASAESQVQSPEQTANQQSAKQNPVMASETPGFSNKFERGKKRRESIVDKFDDQGNLIERTENVYDQNGNVQRKHRYTYRYDDRGQRVEQWFYQSTPDDRPIQSSVNHTKYNNKGWKTENIYIGYDAQGNEINWAKNVYKHNSAGQVTEDVTSNKSGFPVFKVNYNYEDGVLVSENFVYYDGKGGVTEKKTLKYDPYGTVIETINE